MPNRRRPSSSIDSSDEAAAASSGSSSNSSGSDSSSSNDFSLRRVGDPSARRKFKRLRRIFLSQPSTQVRVSAPHSPSPSPTRQRRSTTVDNDERLRAATSALGARRQREAARPLQEAIDQQIDALCDQVALLSAQRDTNSTHQQQRLRAAIDELQQLKQHEHSALQTQVRLIHESYALRLKVFEQQYLAKVDEIRREMQAAVQQKQEQSDAAVLAAVQQLQEQTRAALLSEMLPARERPTESQREHSQQRSTSDNQRWKGPAERAPPPSPMSKQRAKLQALESKLRALPAASVHRAIRSQQPTPPPIQTASEPHEGSETRDAGWTAAPLSPLRLGPSRWRRGVSHEAKRVADLDEAGSEASELGMAPKEFTRRYLRPEEERELLHLRNSIGLAKDWIESNVRE